MEDVYDIPRAAAAPAIRWSTRHVVALVVGVGLLAGIVGAVIGGLSTLVLRADARAVSQSLAANAGGGVLTLRAKNDLNLTASHVRTVGRDGNFEFEHQAGVPQSTLSSLVAGTSTRTPIRIGDSNQDVLSLLVEGRAGQTHDLQQWATSGQSLLAIDSRGRLRFGTVTLWTTSRNGRITLYAQAAGGSPRVLAVTPR